MFSSMSGGSWVSGECDCEVDKGGEGPLHGGAKVKKVSVHKAHRWWRLKSLIGT